MRRATLLIFTGLTLACLSGCHFHWWHHKHHKDYAYANYDACGCDGVYASSADAGLMPIPLSHTISSSTGAIPGPPVMATPAPAGTKISTPTNK
jgi:hypothetical protein